MITLKMCCVYTLPLSPQCRGNNARFVSYKQKWQCNVNITAAGKRAVVLPTGCPRSVGLLTGIFWTKKSKSLLFSGAERPRLQMTGVLHILV